MNIEPNKNLFTSILVILFFALTGIGYLAYFPIDRDLIITPGLFTIYFLVNLSSAIIFFIVLYTIGGCFSKYLANDRLEKINYKIFRMVLGICLLSFTYLILGISGALSYQNLFNITSLLVVLGIYFSNKYPAQKLFNIKFVLDLCPSSILKYTSIAATSFFVVMGLLICSTPETEWDTAVYHIPAIREFMRTGFIGIYPENEPFNFPMAQNLIFIPFDYFKLDSGIRFFNLLILLIGIGSLYQISKLTLKKPYSYFAPIMMTSSYYLWANCASARVEVALCAFIIVYYLLKLHAFRRNSIQLFLLALIVLGMVAATKSTGLVFALLEVFTIILSYLIDRGIVKLKFRNATYLTAISFTLLIFPSLWWYGKNQLAFNSFNYPKSALVNKNVEGNDFESMLQRTKIFFARKYPQYSEIIIASDNFSNSLRNSFYLPVPTNTLDYSILGLVRNPQVFSYQKQEAFNIFLMFSMLVWIVPNKKIWFSAFPFFITLLSILIKGHLIRYSIPITGALAYFSASILQQAEIKKFRKFYLVLLVTAFAIVFYNQFDVARKYLRNVQLFQLFLNGSSTINSYFDYAGFSRTPTSVALFNLINKYVPENETVMMIGENKAMDLIPNGISDQDQLSRQAIPWLREMDDTYGNQLAIYNNLKRKNIKYLAVNVSYYKRYYQKARFYEENDLRIGVLDRCHPKLLKETLIHLAEFIKLYTKPVIEDNKNNIFIYKIKDEIISNNPLPKRTGKLKKSNKVGTKKNRKHK